jgi:predicted DNA-binding WGR domain protein
MTTIHLGRREPSHDQHRFYVITVSRTLFGSWTLIREWGCIGHPGTVRESWFGTEAAAIEAVAKIRRQKEKRGYCAISRAGQGLRDDNRDCGNFPAVVPGESSRIPMNEGTPCRFYTG